MLTTRVPNMIGMSAIECIEACLKMNLNCKINSDSDIEGICTAQSVTSGSTVYAGDIIYVTLTNTGTVSQPQPTPTPTPVPGGEDGVTDALPPEHHDEDDT
jgi:stage V sporulation protein D (sporulation-specific penicillin-binding protein)